MPENTKRPGDYETLDDYFNDCTITEMFGLDEIDQAAEVVLQGQRAAQDRRPHDHGDPQETIALSHVTLQRVREMVSTIDDPSFQYETEDLKEAVKQTINRTLNIITFGRDGYARILAEKQGPEGGNNDL